MRMKDVLKYIDNIRVAKIEGTNRALIKAGFFVQNEVKASIAGQRGEPTSVDTGRFLNSVSVKEAGNLQVSIFTDIEYAKFLEYGTSKLEPRPHFTNTAKRVNKAVKDLIKDGIR